MKGILVVYLTLFASCLFSQKIVLFDGSNLDNWVIPEDAHCWIVRDGILEVKSDEKKKGSNLWTKEKFVDFSISADFINVDGTIDSGFFLRSEKNQLQIGISGSLKRDMTASPYVVGKGYPVEATGVKDILKANDWNNIKAEVRGKQIVAYLNGQKVMEYTTEEIPAEGPIGLQLHPGNEMTIIFKDIVLEKL
ncbi:MAG: DUF1080 domain-containing protein [Saprospiraceae bacterium]|nr:DUF1080 domain-containing protein [Saprospiraceae bacterium]